jgi:3-deoxy-D-arabino-heptulosonate 7-phosphate (DAHP) synthase
VKPLPTWEEVTQAVTIEDGMIRVVEMRSVFGESRGARMSDNKWGGKVSAEIVRARCDLDNTTETLGVAAKRVGLTLSALRNGLFEPRGGLFIGSVPEACGRALSKLAETTQNEGTAVGEWALFIDQLHVLPRFTDLAKYGGKLVRA